MKMNLSSTMVSFGILFALGTLLLKVKDKVEKEICPLFFSSLFRYKLRYANKEKRRKVHIGAGRLISCVCSSPSVISIGG